MLQIASVDCGLVLKKVPELLCFPEVYEDCKDVAQEIPYIGLEEKCEELLFDECVEVEIWRLSHRTPQSVHCFFRSRRKYLLKFARGKDWTRNQYFCLKALSLGRKVLKVGGRSLVVDDLVH